jgi:hypothetical protein
MKTHGYIVTPSANALVLLTKGPDAKRVAPGLHSFGRHASSHRHHSVFGDFNSVLFEDEQ